MQQYSGMHQHPMIPSCILLHHLHVPTRSHCRSKCVGGWGVEELGAAVPDPNTGEGRSPIQPQNLVLAGLGEYLRRKLER